MKQESMRVFGFLKIFSLQQRLPLANRLGLDGQNESPGTFEKFLDSIEALFSTRAGL